MAHLDWSSPPIPTRPVGGDAAQLFSRLRIGQSGDRRALQCGHIRREGDAFKFIAWA